MAVAIPTRSMGEKNIAVQFPCFGTTIYYFAVAYLISEI